MLRRDSLPRLLLGGLGTALTSLPFLAVGTPRMLGGTLCGYLAGLSAASAGRVLGGTLCKGFLGCALEGTRRALSGFVCGGRSRDQAKKRGGEAHNRLKTIKPTMPGVGKKPKPHNPEQVRC